MWQPWLLSTTPSRTAVLVLILLPLTPLTPLTHIALSSVRCLRHICLPKVVTCSTTMWSGKEASLSSFLSGKNVQKHRPSVTAQSVIVLQIFWQTFLGLNVSSKFRCPRLCPPNRWFSVTSPHNFDKLGQTSDICRLEKGLHMINQDWWLFSLQKLISTDCLWVVSEKCRYICNLVLEIVAD